MRASEVALVIAWHDALNAGDVERLLALSSEDVEVGGPRGSGRGAHLLREWFGRAGVRLEVGRVFQRADTVVVEQQAEWRDADTGKLTGALDTGTVFRVRDGKVAHVLRYDDLRSALRAAEVDGSDEVRGGR